MRLSIAFVYFLLALPAYAGAPLAPATSLTLVNPYPATGAADIAGTSAMTRALRAMQSFATPSTTDALLRNLQRLLVATLAAEVTVIRNPRGGGTAAAQSVNGVDSAMLLFGGSGLTAGTTPPAMRRLQPVALVARIPLVLVIHANGLAGNLAQLLEQSARRTRPLQIGIPGERTAGQLLVLQLQREGMGRIVAVTYNGGNGALRGVLSGQVATAISPLPAVLPYAAGQRIRILAIAANARHAVLPAVPTFAESGLPAVTAAGWHGLFAAPSMAAADLRQLQNALMKALQTQDARDALAGLGYVAEFGDGSVLRRALLEELDRTADNNAATRFNVPILPAVLPRETF